MSEYVVSYILNREIVLHEFDREIELEEDLRFTVNHLWWGNVPPPHTQTGIWHTV